MFNSFCKHVRRYCILEHQIINDQHIPVNFMYIFQYISNKMQLYTVYLYLETALHVSGDNSTHHQERIQLYLPNLVFVTPIPLPAGIVQEFQLLHDSGR